MFNLSEFRYENLGCFSASSRTEMEEGLQEDKEKGACAFYVGVKGGFKELNVFFIDNENKYQSVSIGKFFRGDDINQLEENLNKILEKFKFNHVVNPKKYDIIEGVKREYNINLYYQPHNNIKNTVLMLRPLKGKPH